MLKTNSAVKRRQYIKSIGAAGSAVALAGCAFGSGSGNETITIGSTIPKSGSLSSVGKKIQIGYELGVEAINDNGGIDGQELELILKDDESDARTVRDQLQSITSNNDVDMLWGSFSSLLVTAGSAYAENQQIPFLGITFAYMQPHLNKNFEWTFAPYLKSRDIDRGTTSLLNGLDSPEKVAIWEPNTGWGQEMAEQWEQSVTEAGYDVVLRKTYSLGNSDYSTLISQTENARADVLLSNPVPPGAITAVKQMKDIGYSPDLTLFVRGSAPEAFWGALNQDAAYICNMPGWGPGMTTSGSQDLIELFRGREGVEANAVPDANVGPAFNVAQVTEQAISAAESTENTAIQEALLDTQFDTTMGQFTFADNGMPAEGEMQTPVIQWWDGQQMVVHPQTEGDYAMPPKYPAPPWSER